MMPASAQFEDRMPEGEGEKAWPRPAYAWYVVFILLLAYSLATLDRVVVGLLVDSIQRDLVISDTQMSLLIGLAFSLFYTLFGLPIGMLVDRGRRVTVLGIGVIMWSGATAACGMASSFAGLFMSRVFVGIGEATVTPSCSSIISDYFPPKRRARAFGVYMLGGALGTGLAYLLGSFAIWVSGLLQGTMMTVAGLRDWQLVFILTGLPGVLLGILMFFTVREPVRRENSDRQAVSQPVSLAAVFASMKLRKLAYLAVIGGAVMNQFLIYAQLSWYPTFFIRVFDVKPGDVGSMLAMVGLPAGIISALSSGFLMSWAANRGRTDGPLLIIMGQAVVWGVLGIAKCLSPTVEMSLAFHFVTALTSNWGVPAALMGVTQITRNQYRGQVTAIYSLLSGIVGVTLGPLAVGFLSDHVFTERSGIAYSLTSVYAVGAATGLLFLAIGWRAFNRASREMEG